MTTGLLSRVKEACGSRMFARMVARRPPSRRTRARQGLADWRGILGHAMADHDTSDPTLVRLGAFSDGVFAFAITLLVVAIRIPHPNDADAGRGLLVLLSEQWRSYFAFVLSFMLGGINWANHRVMFATFSHADHTLTWLNLLYLLFGVAFIPIPTAVLGAWLGNPDNQVVAAVSYGAAARQQRPRRTGVRVSTPRSRCEASRREARLTGGVS
jgi:hypothetical protein